MTVFQSSVFSLNTSAFLYLAACISFFISVARSGTNANAKWAKFSVFVFGLAWLFHTGGLLLRWGAGGIDRPPWTNLYESLVFFAWGASTVSNVGMRKWKVPLLGVFAAPLIFILMGMSVMTTNKAVEPLIPALQSYWLKIHVVFGMTSYAGFTVAGVFAFLHILKNRVSLSKICCALSLVLLLNLLIAGGQQYFSSGSFYMAKTVLRTMPDGTEVMVKDVDRDPNDPEKPPVTRMELVPHATIPFTLALLGFLASAVLGFVDRKKKTISPLLQKIFGAALVCLLLLFVTIAWGIYSSVTLTFQSNPYLMTLLLMTFFVGAVFWVITYKYEAFLATLPSAAKLDELSYKNILFAFPFQTLLLITGAIWAYFAWGRAWGWDPKETWALITWMAFLIYLHGKLLMNWRPNTLSAWALMGFMILIFAFLGVNLVLSGLHSYGAA